MNSLPDQVSIGAIRLNISGQMALCLRVGGSFGKLIKNVRFVMSFLLATAGSGLAQELPPPVNFPISSDYGPRNLDGKYKWHGGIDYASLRWTPVKAVEEGDITYINSSVDKNPAGWRIRVEGDDRFWTYMHLFYTNANPISPDKKIEAATVLLENSENPGDRTTRNVFIFWVDRSSNIAERVLAFTEGNREWTVRWGNGYILDQAGSSITTQGYVSERETLGPSGESGSAVGRPHLHLSAHKDYLYDINPLYYVQHATPSYTVTIPFPLEGATLFRIPGLADAEQAAERVRVKVVSGGANNTGNDLDRVKLYLFPMDGSWTEPIFDNSRLAATIAYGGLPPSAAEDKNPFPVHITTAPGANKKTGVVPVGGMGEEDFYFAGLNTKLKPDGKTEALLSHEAKFPDGGYQMAARAHSIRHNNQECRG